jgi:hypothetical protein
MMAVGEGRGAIHEREKYRSRRVRGQYVGIARISCAL